MHMAPEGIDKYAHGTLTNMHVAPEGIDKCRRDRFSGVSKDAPSTGSAPAHGPTRAATPPLSQNEPSRQHHQPSVKQESDDADKDGAVQSGIHPGADVDTSPMHS